MEIWGLISIISSSFCIHSTVVGGRRACGLVYLVTNDVFFVVGRSFHEFSPSYLYYDSAFEILIWCW